MSEILKPCPFCGSERVEALDKFDFVACQECGASLEDSEPSARVLWNRRAPSQSSAVSEQPVASGWPDNSYVYRFEYADGSAFEVLEDGRAFIAYKDGRREEKRGKIDSRIRLLVGRAVKPLHDLLRANGITGAPVRARAALPTREEVIGECLSAMPSTAEDPNESSYQRGRFDGVMEYQREIQKLSGAEPQTAPEPVAWRTRWKTDSAEPASCDACKKPFAEGDDVVLMGARGNFHQSCFLARAEPQTAQHKESSVTEDQIKHMVDRFLGWKLPETFSPDNGISFDPIASKGTPYEFRRAPQGTNLLDATQADAMARYMLEGLPQSQAESAQHRYDQDGQTCPTCGRVGNGEG